MMCRLRWGGLIAHRVVAVRGDLIDRVDHLRAPPGVIVEVLGDVVVGILRRGQVKSAYRISKVNERALMIQSTCA
jgi:hypothetical protein